MQRLIANGDFGKEWRHSMQKRKKLFDMDRPEPRAYTDAELDDMCATFVRVWQFGLVEPVYIRGMDYLGNCVDYGF